MAIKDEKKNLLARETHLLKKRGIKQNLLTKRGQTEEKTNADKERRKKPYWQKLEEENLTDKEKEKKTQTKSKRTKKILTKREKTYWQRDLKKAQPSKKERENKKLLTKREKKKLLTKREGGRERPYWQSEKNPTDKERKTLTKERK